MNTFNPTNDASFEDNRHSISDFVEQTRQRDRGQGLFEFESERLLEVNLNGDVWIKKGAMVAYRGNVKFVREKILEHGVGQLLKKAVSGEGTQLMTAQGQGQVYLADEGKKVAVLQLENEAIFVNGNDVLAFEKHLDYEVKMMRKMTAMMAGGLFNVRLQGSGLIAITTHYDPMTLIVEPGAPVFTDPNATVAWSGSLTPEFKTDVSLKTFFGRGSGESIQMKFEGEGFVIVQPFEETYFQQQTAGR